jgi:superfamily II DNA or RNA helicase
MATIKLRDYQADAIAAVQRDWEAGYTDVLGVMATGGGKTAVFLALLVDELSRHSGGRALIIAHRKELIEQPIERLAQFWPEWALRAGIVMGQRDECDRQITVATVQTLASRKRLARILAHGEIDYLIIDEAHHAVAGTYVDVVRTLRDRNPHLRHLGVTATPLRADEQGLRQVYQKTSFCYDIKPLVKSGWLVPPRWLAIQTGISLAGVAKRNGDYSAKSLANVYETQNCFDLVVESHKQYADGRQCIAFVETVDGAYKLAKTFNQAGIKAAAADGTTAKSDRGEILAGFRAGRTQVLCNVALWTEGLDVPQVSCIHQVRPTQSDALYLQMIGRALRPVPGKEDALILDYAPLEARNICMAGDVLGVDARKDVYIKESEERGEVVGGFTFDGSVKWLTGDPMEIISRELNYLDLSPWSWHRGSDGWLSLGLGAASDGIDRTLAISPAAEDGRRSLWGVAKREGDRYPRAYLIREGEFEALSEVAEGLIERWANATLAAKGRRWRREFPTEAQARFAQRLGVYEGGLSKGELAARITHALAVRSVRRCVA